MKCAGVANSDKTFADTSEDPVPKHRKQRKAGTAAAEEDQTQEAAGAAGKGAKSDQGLSLGQGDSEPAELGRTAAAEVAADADVSIAASQGEAWFFKTDKRSIAIVLYRQVIYVNLCLYHADVMPDGA